MTAINPISNVNLSLPVKATTANAVEPGPSMGGDGLLLTGLTAEEVQLMQQGLLPPTFADLRKIQREQGKDAAIAAFRQGKKGPFERRYGDPDVMMSGARRFAADPEQLRMVKAIKPGDILCITYNKPDDVIANATKGPFIHALVCVSDGAPPEFVEALGASGNMSDPDSNKVLRSMMATNGGSNQTVRILRPTEGMQPLEAEKAIKRAINYTIDQLGKPYDFAFTDTNGTGMNDAFYCSELAYKAYADRKGADLPLRLSKAPERDVALAAVSQVLGELKPDDKGALTFGIAQVAAQKPLDENKLVDYIVNQVAPSTEATRSIADTPARRAALKVMVQKLVAGKGVERITAALQQFGKDEQQGRFKGIGGFFRRVEEIGAVGVAGIRDVRALSKGVGFWRSLGVTWKLSRTLVPHAETISNFLFGANDDRSKQVHAALDQLDGMARDAHRIPLIGGLWPLPSRARPEANRDFVSPTDLAWAAVPHYDFNVKPNYPIDQAEWNRRGLTKK
ncbi:MAG: hypothetical protein JWM80_949 [Cyanobacteria bacterium RYN_339]|nr:hypothetical protein [Cyanobacteria bacterium RYN_339]